MVRQPLTVSVLQEQLRNIYAVQKSWLQDAFATHYHELIELENLMEGVKNYSIAVKKSGDGIRFLRKIVKGGVDESYGIEVAKLAGLPNKVVKRARELLAEMELENKTVRKADSDDGQISFEILNRDILADRLRKQTLPSLLTVSAEKCLRNWQSLLIKAKGGLNGGNQCTE